MFFVLFDKKLILKTRDPFDNYYYSLDISITLYRFCHIFIIYYFRLFYPQVFLQICGCCILYKNLNKMLFILHIFLYPLNMLPAIKYKILQYESLFQFYLLFDGDPASSAICFDAEKLSRSIVSCYRFQIHFPRCTV